MMKKKTNKLTAALMITGALLVLSSLAFVIITASLERTAQENSRIIADRMLSLMPEIRNAQTDDRIDTAMASLNIDGTDYCAILEVPRYQACMPIAAKWDKARVRMTPCRYTGSIYDGTLIIGGADVRGQLDFISDITEGDAVLLTDAEGNCYAYEVSAIELSEDASTDVLTGAECDLVLFARNTYGGGYTVVRCKN